MNLAEWARLQGVHPGRRIAGFGRIVAGAGGAGESAHGVGQSGCRGRRRYWWVGLYARVRSHDQRDDLDRQVARLGEWAAQAGAAVVRV